MGPATPTDYEGFLGDASLGHRRDSKFDDVRPGVAALRPAQLHPPPLEVTPPQNEYCQELLDRLEMAYATLREQQKLIRQKDQEEP